LRISVDSKIMLSFDIPPANAHDNSTYARHGTYEATGQGTDSRTAARRDTHTQHPTEQGSGEDRQARTHPRPRGEARRDMTEMRMIEMRMRQTVPREIYPFTLVVPLT